MEVVTNDLDGWVGVGAQCICGLPIHLELSINGPNNGHAAAFYSSYAVDKMASFIGYQRR